MPQVRNIPRFWIYQESLYASFIYFGFWIYKSSESVLEKIIKITLKFKYPRETLKNKICSRCLWLITLIIFLFLNNIHFLRILGKSLRNNEPPTILSSKSPWLFLQYHQHYSLSTPHTLLTMAHHSHHPG